MSTLDTPPAGYPAEITGYAEPWIVNPGDTVAIKVSCTEPEYSYRTIRVIQGVDVPHSPKKAEEVISAIPAGTAKGRFQLCRQGSYGIVEEWLPVPVATIKGGLQVSFFMQPWLPLSGHTQTALSTLDAAGKTGLAVVITDAGLVQLWVGTGDAVEVIETGFSPEKKRWVEVSLVLDGTSVSASLSPLVRYAEPGAAPVAVEHSLQKPFAVAASDALVFGGSFAASATAAFPRATNFFNGRIDSPSIRTVAKVPTTLVRYDFSRAMTTDRFVDVSGHGRDGVLVNAPTRAIRGHDWDGSETDWSKAKYGYGAVHFHDDDIDDAAWETDFTITVPAEARSGAYCVEVASTNGKTTDSIPFFVRPGAAAWKQREGKVAFVLSTFTYLAYANEHLYDDTRSSATDVGPGFSMDDIAQSEDFERMKRRTDCGLCPYDVHNDDSGVVFSSSRRPILNLRPGYVMWAFKRPREYSADLMFVGFLEREGIPYEVLTDHDLHERGAAALAGFNTVVTGSHPEYPSAASYAAYTAFARQGGNLMYLGGNGFYWVTCADLGTRPHRVEVRRGDAGVRTTELPGGERHNSMDGGSMGTLWRSRGKPCNAVFGIGFSGEGIGDGVPFARSELSRTDASVAWMFEGLSAEGLIGEFGLGGGASGDEIDRFAVEMDSPPGVRVLASSTGHPDTFGVAPEDIGFPIVNTLGTQNPNIRSDIAYYVTAGGGGVFSVGSINWFCSLGWDDYDNTVATLTGNVLKGFLKGLR